MTLFHLLTLACSANVFFTGLFAGALLFDRWGITPVRPTLPPDAFVRFQQGQHLNVMRLMPTLLVLSIVSGGTAAFLMRGTPLNFRFAFTVASTSLMFAILILTRAINVPINNTLMRWSAANPRHLTGRFGRAGRQCTLSVRFLWYSRCWEVSSPWLWVPSRSTADRS